MPLLNNATEQIQIANSLATHVPKSSISNVLYYDAKREVQKKE